MPEWVLVATISTIAETDNPEEEIKPALEVLGSIKEKFITVSEIYEPKPDFSDNIFITRSMDHQSHTESVVEDVMRLYKEITGKDIDFGEELEDTNIDMNETNDETRED